MNFLTGPRLERILENRDRFMRADLDLEGQTARGGFSAPRVEAHRVPLTDVRGDLDLGGVWERFEALNRIEVEMWCALPPLLAAGGRDPMLIESGVKVLGINRDGFAYLGYTKHHPDPVLFRAHRAVTYDAGAPLTRRDHRLAPLVDKPTMWGRQIYT